VRAPPARLDDVNPSKPLVAVVDDEEPVRRALERLFRSAGLETETFASGGAMLDDLPRRQPDCVVLDLHMPGMSGFDLQQALDSFTPRIPVVVLTGHDTPETFARAMGAGAAAYLRKPVDGDALLSAVLASCRPR
jgi:FixJ family two-component response regulator